MNKIAIINGPNLNQLGFREKDLYGNFTYEQLLDFIADFAKKIGCEVLFYQSNIEGEIINFIHSIKDRVDGIIINAAAYTHTSIAIRDALLIFNKPVVEVHISNIYKRESFRKTSLIADIAEGVIAGFGKYSYIYALDYLNNIILKS